MRNKDEDEMSLDDKMVRKTQSKWAVYSSLRTRGEILTVGFYHLPTVAWSSC